MSQAMLWNDRKVRAERQAAAEKAMGRKMELAPLPAPAQAAPAPLPAAYPRGHYERLLDLFERRSPRVGPLVAMQEAMEEHDRVRDVAAAGRRKVPGGPRRVERRA